MNHVYNLALASRKASRPA